MAPSRPFQVLVLTLALSSVVLADTLPSSYPHVYPGQPVGDYSPAWQKYFEVTEPLTNITFPLPHSYAGNIGVQRAGHPNDTLFFWALEKQPGSLTAPGGPAGSTEPWGIWLNGGPGSSSMVGFFLENGPIRIAENGSVSFNQYAWNNVADYFWIDQPVGVGFSTADANGYVADEEQVGADFMGFLENLVKVFPSLATRPLYLTGESYSGVYIPYILKTYFSMAKPPVNIAKIAIGDGSIAVDVVFELLPALSVIEAFPQLIGYDPAVYSYFKEQEHLCGYDINLTYPQNGIIPAISFIDAKDRDVPYLERKERMSLAKRGPGGIIAEVNRRYAELDLSERQDRPAKRDLAGRANGTLDPWYGCALLPEFVDYAVNFSAPWNVSGGEFNVYDITDPFGSPSLSDTFLNDAHTRAALHAPTSKDWEESFDYTFGQLEGNDPSPVPMNFLTELATNATSHNISIILYSGNDDSLIAHRGTEVTIQNTTFGGIQGFTQKPSTVWFDDEGAPAGIVHQERGWTYVLVNNTGHLIPAKAPAVALTFLREFVFGDNPTGSISGLNKTLVGGATADLIGEFADVIAGPDGIVYQVLNSEGESVATKTFVYPEETIAAWKTFIRGQTLPAATGVAAAQPNDNASTSSSGTKLRASGGLVVLVVGLFGVLAGGLVPL
ncbi:hypothetical protein HMN09_00677500 [Mycena chlorophos]|uniref:Carboxypeptidase n=1 Tax=Mycena chlorophos TaxID=658473 RepID=A0A8H6SZZ0_MYCCL|nr:hypothetical protein HMN09_00677500 [Mycena chlorophos]